MSKVWELYASLDELEDVGTAWGLEIDIILQRVAQKVPNV
jgi:hypothetical protein